MYFFAAKGITPVQNGMAEITVGALFTDNQQSGNPDKDYLLTQHAATFRKTIARQWIIYSFVAKETTKGIHYGNCINRKKNF